MVPPYHNVLTSGRLHKSTGDAIMQIMMWSFWGVAESLYF